jgi:hypothetical protein
MLPVTTTVGPRCSGRQPCADIIFSVRCPGPLLHGVGALPEWSPYDATGACRRAVDARATAGTLLAIGGLLGLLADLPNVRPRPYPATYVRASP